MTLVNTKEQTLIDVSDRGLAYGDGLFETIACIDGKLHNWDLHWQRLQAGAERLAIKLPDEQYLLKQIDMELGQSSDTINDRVVKVIVTRGSGGRGYQFPELQQSTVIVTAHPWPERPVQDYQQGIHAVICHTCLARQPALAGIKHLNRLEQVLGRNEFNDSVYQEGIMLSCSDTQESFIVEATSSNLFFVNNGNLCTPEITDCGVRGTLREAIISFAAQIGINVHQGRYSLQQLGQASEVFFSNSVYGIVPVASINNKDLSNWYYIDRTITTQFAEHFNKALKRPVRLN